ARIDTAAHREGLRVGQAAGATANKCTDELTHARQNDECECQPQEAWLGECAEVDAEASYGKEDWHEERDDEAAQRSVHALDQKRRLTEQDSGDESPEDEVHAQCIGDERHEPGDDQY